MKLPLLVLDNIHDDPEWPFDVASTDASIVAVLWFFVRVVVEKV